MQESATHNSFQDFVPIDCPLCSWMMRDIMDCAQYLETRCCVECWVSFLEPLRKLRKDEDYTPTEEEIKEWNQKLAKCDN